ncbi:kinase-like protein [Pilatotrama ljubarskyi]|nr:kinase-like protein [Pilatotrama ljubarskyi]
MSPSPPAGGGEVERDTPALPAPLGPDALEPDEVFWRDHQKWLEEQGYMLRSRYRPEWVPSWKGTTRDPDDCEDGISSFIAQIMDAQRISDGAVVALKRISKSIHPHEVDITRMFSAEPLSSDARNHCVPVYDVLESPNDNDIVFLVMPYLRLYKYPRFCTVGEAVECFRQLFEGLQFIHQQHVAHRDIMHRNIMMDPTPLVTETPHPLLDPLSYDTHRKVKYSTRTRHPVKYFFIDFGISRKYPVECTEPREPPIWGGDKTVPEFQHSNEPRDPFATDVYYLGNLIRKDFLEKGSSLDFMVNLIGDMVQDDPAKRPTIDEVVERYDKLRASLSTRTLRSRIVHKKDSNIVGFLRTIRHVYRTIEYIVTRTPAIPTPRS